MATGRKITFNAISLSLSKILSTALALVSIGLITRYLGKEGFGSYATVMAFFSLFGAVADLGLYSISTREISREKADEKEIIGNVFTLRIMMSIAVFLLAPVLVLFFPYDPQVKIGIIIAAGSFVFSSSYLVLNGVFQKKLAMHKVALAELLGKVIQVLIVYYVVKNSLGFTLLLFSLLASMAFNFILVFIFSRKYLKFKLRFNLPYWKKFLKQSIPVGISAIITFLYFKMDTILLSVMKGGADVGIYNAAYKVLENLTFFPAMIVGLTLPLTSRYIFTDRKLFSQISNNTFKAFVAIVIPLSIGIYILAGDIINVIGGPGYEEAVPVLRTLVFALFFIFFGNFANNILLAGNQQKQMMKVLSFCAAFNIVLNLVLIPAYSYRGAAFTSAITELLVVILTFWLLRHKLNFFPKADKIYRIIFSNILFAFGVYLLRQEFGLIFTLIFSLALYVFLLWITKSITKNELMSLFSKGYPSGQPIAEIS